VEVYFDDFKVEHVKSPVIQSDDYYPFGLRYNSYSRENSLINKSKLFQGQEHIEDLGLNWDSFKWRNYMPDIGRFFNIDRLTEKYAYNSPYAFSENHVTTHVELEGLEKVDFMAALVTPHEEVGHKVDNGGGVYVTKTKEINKDFGEVGQFSGQTLTSTIDVGTGEQSDLTTFEASHAGGLGDGIGDMFHLDGHHFDYDQSTEKTKNGSVITGQIEGTEFTINVGVGEKKLTFDATIKGGDSDKAFAIKVNGITISFGEGGRNSDGEVRTRAVVPYTMDKNGNAVIDANYHSKAREDDEKTDTQKKD
jgi:RHS repeat-associated protein